MQMKLIFIWKVLHENSFEREAQGDSEMAYLETYCSIFTRPLYN